MSVDSLVESYVKTGNTVILLNMLYCCKGPSSQSYGFSSSHVRMSELDCEES